MSDNSREKRPNANYKLSPSKVNDERQALPFYYDRERRLEKAPESVKALYNNNKPVRSGLLYSLTADRPRRFLLVMIILLCLIILVLSIFGYLDTSYTLDGNRIDITAARYEETSIIVLNKQIKNKNAYNGAVDIAVSIAVEDGEDYPVFTHRIFFTIEKEEIYRFAVPFNNPELLMVLQSEKDTLQIKFNPK